MEGMGGARVQEKRRRMLQFGVHDSIGASLLPTSALLPTQPPDSKPQPQDDGKDGHQYLHSVSCCCFRSFCWSVI